MACNVRTGLGKAIILIGLLSLTGLAIHFSQALVEQLQVLGRDVEQLLSGNFDPDTLSTSVGLRARLWSAAWSLAVERPVFGYGLGSFPANLQDVRIDPVTVSLISGFNQLHNEYLDLLVETGVVGLTLFSALLATAFAGGIALFGNPVTRYRACALLWIVSCYASFGLTQAYLSHANTSLQLGAYLGMLVWTIPKRSGAEA